LPGSTLTLYPMNAPTFSPDVYKSRRATLKSKIASGIILLPANLQSPINYTDNAYAFRQDSTFLYYFDLDLDALVGVIDVDNDQEILFGNDATVDDLVWTGPKPTVQELAQQVGITSTKPLTALGSLLSKATADKRTIHWLAPYRADVAIRLSEWLALPIRTIQNASSKSLVNVITEQRIRKSKEEIVELEKAVSVSADMHLVAIRSVQAGMFEYELLSHIEAVAYAHNCRTSYPSIVTTNGQTLHNHYYGNKLQEGRMVLCDSGAELPSGYCGDLTRTFPIGKNFSQKQKEVYQIVLNALTLAEGLLKPGVLFKDIHLAACRELTKGLQQLGLMRGNVDESVNAGAHALFFQCGLGHLIGLDVHDMENLGEDQVGYGEEVTRNPAFGIKSLRLARRLQEGFTLTVEPGLYFIPELIDMWKKDKKFESFINYSAAEAYKTFGGIRIEDNLLVTADGSHLLGKPLAKTINEIEALRA